MRAQAGSSGNLSGMGGSTGSVYRSCTNMSGLLLLTQKTIQTMKTRYGPKAKDNRPLEIFEQVLTDLKSVDKLMKKLMTVSEKNPAPSSLDQSQTIVGVVQKCKETIEGILKYVDDYHKRTSIMQIWHEKAITSKIKANHESMLRYKAMIEQLSEQFLTQHSN